MNFSFHLGRSLSWKYQTHRQLFLFCAVAGLCSLLYWTIFQSIQFSVALLAGFMLVTSIGITWALARELDPDHPYSAFVALPFVLLNIFLFGFPSFGISIWFILLSRAVTHSTGRRLTITDLLLLVILPIIYLLTMKLVSPESPIIYQFVEALSITSLAITTTFSLTPVHSVSDYHHFVIQTKNVRLSILLLGVICAILTILTHRAVSQFSTVLASFLGILLFRIVTLVRQKK